MQVTLKLRIDDKNVPALHDHVLLKNQAVFAPIEQQIQETFFDTADFSFFRHGASLRLGQINNVRFQSIKTRVESPIGCGLTHYVNLQTWLNGAELNFSALRKLADRKTACGKLLRLKNVEHRIQAIFVTQFSRTVWKLRLSEGQEITCTLDQGHIKHDDKIVPINEIGLELNSGAPTTLIDFALALQQDIPLQINMHSKVDQGYALRCALSLSAIQVQLVKLSAQMTITEAFVRIVNHCLLEVQTNADGINGSQSTECLHQMRVGLRRLRSVIGFFSAVHSFPLPLKQELDWLAIELGVARDWTVFNESTLPSVLQSHADAEQSNNQHAQLTALTSTLADNKLVLASAVIGSKRYVRIILCLIRWLQECEWHAMPTPTKLTAASTEVATDLNSFFHTLLTQNQKRLIQRGKNIADMNSTSLHRLRIAAKKMRYSMEFYYLVIQSKKVKRYIDGIIDLQDRLGSCNDAVTADRFLTEIQNSHTELATDAAFFRGYLAARYDNEKLNVRQLWEKVILMKLPFA